MAERAIEIDMMRSPEKWPRACMLPLKKPGAMNAEPGDLTGFGVIFDHPEHGLLFFENTLIFFVPDDSDKGVPADPDALYDAGWRVD